MSVEIKENVMTWSASTHVFLFVGTELMSQKTLAIKRSYWQSFILLIGDQWGDQELLQRNVGHYESWYFENILNNYHKVWRLIWKAVGPIIEGRMKGLATLVIKQNERKYRCY